MEIKGTVLQVLAAQSGMGKKGEWKKQEFVIKTDGQYPKNVCLALWGDKQCPPVGATVTAAVELESREYNGKWYTEARAWKLEINFDNSYRQQASQPTYDPYSPRTSQQGTSPSTSDDQDLPF